MLLAHWCSHGGCATEKPANWGVFALLSLGSYSNLDTIYLFSENRRGYREAGFQKAALTGIDNEHLTFFYSYSMRLQSVLQKSFGASKAKCQLLFLFLTANRIYEIIGVKIPLKMFGAM